MYTENLSLAGIRFHVRSEVSLRPESAASAYIRFLGPLPAGSSYDLLHECQILEGPPQDSSGCEAVFSAPNWRLRREGGTRFIEGFAWADPQLMWCCRTADDLLTSELRVTDLYRRLSGDGPAIGSPLRFPLDQILIMQLLAGHGGVILHAAGISVEGKGMALLGQSGAGKSTTARLLLDSGKARAVSDDRVIIRSRADRFAMHGTPWGGQAQIAENCAAPLHALIFLRQAKENALQRLSPREVAERLFPVSSIPWFDPVLMVKALDVCQQLAENVPAYVCSLRPDDEAVAMLVGLA